MPLFPKKDKLFNDYNDNYINSYRQTALSGLAMACIGGSIYGIYKLVEWLFF
ncbi:hypothetical protein SAMN05428642_10397 [Flaviramulus basaltis]|uniref:Uncharacterized protein n=1 Tax=Flaviramulus basaltis TaxID=369401 RepID=A0A1K2ILY0_9FLAO|nr:hypothetical protein [Flaviramulus basaltis]SFZ93375.1 hypothetical protein SAMN05428642_10397 [Flaviramulus basaltis]